MKFKVTYFSPDLEMSALRNGETSIVLMASDTDQAFYRFRDMFPDWNYPVRRIERVPDFGFHDNVEMRASDKKNNFTLDSKNPMFEEFFAFDGVVYHADPFSWDKADQMMFVWNGKFDWPFK